jgi:hypothetical protein
MCGIPGDSGGLEKTEVQKTIKQENLPIQEAAVRHEQD